MSHDGKLTFTYGLENDSGRLVDTQSVRAEDADGALRLLRLGGFLIGDSGEDLHPVLIKTEGEDDD